MRSFLLSLSPYADDVTDDVIGYPDIATNFNWPNKHVESVFINYEIKNLVNR